MIPYVLFKIAVQPFNIACQADHLTDHDSKFLFDSVCRVFVVHYRTCAHLNRHLAVMAAAVTLFKASVKL